MKKERTPDEQAQHNHEIIIRRKMRGMATRVKNQCGKAGLSAIKWQLVWLKENPKTKLPIKELDHNQTVEAWGAGIEAYKESLT